MPEKQEKTSSRDVARPVANLGNTCYMNAVLQALAHAPELCMAMDVGPHHVTCPIWRENALKRRSSPSSSPEAALTSGVRKSRRQKSPSPNDLQFCVLCELEQHFNRVHSSCRERPVAPTNFVNGFINQVAPWFKLGQQEDSHEFLRLLIDAMQRSCFPVSSTIENGQDALRNEYPFQLFRGTVESNVTCDSCGHSSATLDPIEDIGLEYRADVATALQRFARPEALDSGYKCEKCGKVGRATKQSRLSSIPPILTLHLKRFRYGETQPHAQQSTQRRSNRSSEVSQLLNQDLTGKSGAAKIEGHSKFSVILDLKPYLTPEMQSKHSEMLCRLFAIIVHAGKNSHSGHYIAYVRNITKNEWWKMDDARITTVSIAEVMSAEAYMLFYRVVEHPFAVELRERGARHQNETKQDETAVQEQLNDTLKPPPAREVKLEDMASVATSSMAMSSVRTNNSRKRKAPEFTSGEAWARAVTSLSESQSLKFRDIEMFISDYVDFKPEYDKFLTDQASRRNARKGHGPSSGICEDDIQGGYFKFKQALLEVFHKLAQSSPRGLFQMSKSENEVRRGILTSLVDPGDDHLL